MIAKYGIDVNAYAKTEAGMLNYSAIFTPEVEGVYYVMSGTLYTGSAWNRSFSKDDFKLYQKGCDYFRSNQKDKTSVKAQADLLAYKTHVINVLGFYNFLTKENDIPEKHLLNYYFDEYFLNGEGLIKP